MKFSYALTLAVYAAHVVAQEHRSVPARGGSVGFLRSSGSCEDYGAFGAFKECHGTCIPEHWACCDWETEEFCYDTETWEPTSCALFEEGGCPCADGRVKCNFWCDDEEETRCDGFCEPEGSPCCDWKTEETCYDQETWDPIDCKLFSEGGCPCPEGEVKCDGWCQPEPQDICCDWPTEETCYDDDWAATSCVPVSEGCPSSGKAQNHHDMSKLIAARGTPKEIANFRNLKLKYHQLSAGEGKAPTNSARHAAEHEMMALAHTIKLRGGLQKGNRSAKNDLRKEHTAELIKKYL